MEKILYKEMPRSGVLGLFAAKSSWSFHEKCAFTPPVIGESILELIDRKDFLNFQGDSDSVLIVSLLKKLFFSIH